MNLQHRNQAPRPQNRHRFDFERKSLKKPEAPGSAGRCEKGTGRSTAPPLCPASLSHPLLLPYLRAVFNLARHGAEFGPWGPGVGSFPYPGGKSRTQALTGRRNPMLFRRKRRVLCTRGFLSDQATGLGLHTGPNGGQQGLPGLGCCWVQKSRRRVLPGSGPGVYVMAFAGNLPILPRPPARRGISAAGNPPAPWRSPSPTGWR